MLTVGEVFWYRMAGKLYGAIVLDYQKDTREYFIGITKEITPVGKEPTIDEVLKAQPYTAAWFDPTSLLNPLRMHSVGLVEVNGEYSNRGGRYKDEETYMNKNAGMKYTWKHTERMLIPQWECMYMMLDCNSFPKTWVY